MTSELRRELRPPSTASLQLLNPKLVFGIAWFWTVPEVQDVQEEIDVRRSEFRGYIGVRDEYRTGR